MTLLGVPFTVRQAILTIVLTPVALVAIWYGLVTYLVAFAPVPS